MGGKPDKPKETASERANADIMLEQYGMQQKLRPVRDDLFKRIKDYSDEKRKLAGTANADRQVAVGAGAVNPSRSAGANVGSALDRAGALSRGGVDTNIAGEKADVGSKLALTGIARGEQKVALAGVQDLAARESEASLAKYRANEQAKAAQGTAALQAIGAGVNIAGGLSGGAGDMSAKGVLETSANQDPSAFGPQSIALGNDWDYTPKPTPI